VPRCRSINTLFSELIAIATSQLTLENLDESIAAALTIALKGAGRDRISILENSVDRSAILYEQFKPSLIQPLSQTEKYSRSQDYEKAWFKPVMIRRTVITESPMIRFITPNDTNALLALAKATGLFESDQVEELAQMLNQHFSAETDSPDLWFTDADDEPVGVAYVSPERMTEGTWNLYLIAIHPDRQRQGRGAALLSYVEKILTERGERVLLVETSGLEDFEYVRVFYRKSGYDEEARIREFYRAGDDKIIFRKALGIGAA
jgi:ribosomal protein S18 acetylase RimI-like enzyme